MRERTFPGKESDGSGRLLKNPWGGNGELVDCHMIPAGRVLYSAGLHSRVNTQAQPAARQAGKEVKREK